MLRRSLESALPGWAADAARLDQDQPRDRLPLPARCALIATDGCIRCRWRQGRSSARQGVLLCLVLVRYVGDVDPVAPARLCLIEGGVGHLEEVGEVGLAWWGAVSDAD